MKKLILLFSILLISTNIVYPQTKPMLEGDLQDWLPLQMNQSNAGKEFFMTFHPCWESGGSDNFLKIYVFSDVATTVTVTVPGKGFEQQQKTTPNSVIVFNLPPNIGQPYAKTDRQLPEDDQVWKQYAVHVEADDPVVCYGVTRFQYTSDGYLAIPVHALGKEYIISSWTDIGSNTIPGGQFLSSFTSCIAPYDKTKVRYTGGGPSFSHTTNGIGVGESKTYNMSQGDVLLMASIGSLSDLSGSKFSADKNIAAISGNFCSYVPEYISACDYLIEQDLPTHTWGTVYIVAPIAKREKNSWVKIYAKEAGTNIYRDGELLGELAQGGGGGKLDECYFSLRVLANELDPRPVVISSDKPISVTQYNTGMSDDGVPSDPFQMVLSPMEQWQDKVQFATPGSYGDGFNENYINIVYQATDAGSIPDDFEFAKIESDGLFHWKKLRDIYPDVGQELEIQIMGKRYFSKIATLPGDGVYKCRANEKFNITSYGFSNWDSYGFPASVGLKDLEKPDTVAPFCDVYIDCYGVVRDANRNGNHEIIVTDMPEDEEYRSNLSQILMAPYPASYNMRFDTEEFIPGEARDAFWSASVVDQSQKARLVFVVMDRCGNSLIDTIEFEPYHGKIVAVDDHDGKFGTFAVGESKTLEYKIVNESKTEPLEISYLKMLSDDSGYWTWKRYREEMRDDEMKMPEEFEDDQGFDILDQNENPIAFDIEIPPEGEYPFKVRFDATVKGIIRDSIGLGESENCYFGYWLPVKASVGEPLIEVSDIDFGEVVANNRTSYKDIIIKNTGNIVLEITDFSGPDLEENGKKIFNYKRLDDVIEKKNGRVLVLKPGEQFVFKVNFTAYSGKKYSDEIVFESNAGNQLDNVCSLNGNGIYFDIIYVYDVSFTKEKQHIASSKTFMVRNAGESDIDIIDFSGPFLEEDDGTGTVVKNFVSADLEESVDPGTGKKITIPASGSVTFSIEFTPHSIKDYKDSIVFRYNRKPTGDSICVLSATDVTSIEDQIAEAMNVYPNPTKDIIKIDTRNGEVIIEKIEVIDIQGVVLMTILDINSTTEQVNLENLANGAYVIQITTNKAKVRKMINLTK
jgi:IgGFc binding protein/type IX secretion system substrate protein